MEVDVFFERAFPAQAENIRRHNDAMRVWWRGVLINRTGE